MLVKEEKNINQTNTRNNNNSVVVITSLSTATT